MEDGSAVMFTASTYSKYLHVFLVTRIRQFFGLKGFSFSFKVLQLKVQLILVAFSILITACFMLLEGKKNRR